MSHRPDRPLSASDDARTASPDRSESTDGVTNPSPQEEPPTKNVPSFPQSPLTSHDATRTRHVKEEFTSNRSHPPMRDEIADGDWTIAWSARQQKPRELGPRLERFGERTEDFVDTIEVTLGRAVPKKLRRWESARQNTMVNVLWRAGVLLVGLTLVTAGIAMLLLPGPGWLTIFLGLAVLASEYTWANRLLLPVRRRVRQAKNKADEMNPRVRRIATAATIVGVLIAGGIATWYVRTYGLAPPW